MVTALRGRHIVYILVCTATSLLGFAAVGELRCRGEKHVLGKERELASTDAAVADKVAQRTALEPAGAGQRIQLLVADHGDFRKKRIGFFPGAFGASFP